MPSEAASVASRMRTGDSAGSAWNAALMASRSFGSMPPIEQREALAAEAVAGEDLVQPLLRGAVLGEEDDPLVRPLALRLQVLVRASRRSASAFESGSWLACCGP